LIARDAASESIILLENKAALPFKNIKNIALYGTASYNTYIGGTGSGDVYEKYSISIADGLSQSGYQIDNELQRRYNAHIRQDKEVHPEGKTTIFAGAPRLIPELDFTQELIEKSAKETDIAILTIGRNSGKGADRSIEDNFNLSKQKQEIKEIIAKLSKAFHAEGKKLIILINTGGVIETASWKNNADAILLIWQPGQEGGNAIADILSGKKNRQVN
jgi:beta-glucosidase